MTIKEIAKLANVSVATVSYVLNDTGSVSDEVRRRVLRIAEETGYRKNIMARGLRTSSSNTIGVLAEDITVWITPEIIHGLSDYVDRSNKNILLTNLALDSKIGKHFSRIEDYKAKIRTELDLLLGAQVEGIVYIGMHDRDITGLLGPLEKPVCAVGCYADDLPYISYDNIDVAEDIARYFTAQGHREVGVIGGSYDSKVTYKRFSGFQRGLQEGGCALSSRNIRTGNWNFEDGYSLARDLLDRPNRPTAVFAMNDLMAAGVLARAVEMGLKVPEELEVFGFDNQQMAAYTYPGLSTAQVPLYDMGYRAAKRIYDILEGRDSSVGKVMLPCSLVFRGSTRVH